MFTDEEIIKAFPFPQMRDGQLECIRNIVNAFENDNKKFVVLEAPTGSGKSVIGMTIANLYENSYYLTVQKILQDQLLKDFESDNIKCLKGRNAYPCDYWDRWLKKHQGNQRMLDLVDKAKSSNLSKTFGASCSEGYCLIKNGKATDGFCFPAGYESMGEPEKFTRSSCPYYKALGDAMNSRTCIMNFSSFLYQTSMSSRFQPRELLIVDEAHVSESQLMDFVNFSITDFRFRKQGVEFPCFTEAKKYYDYFLEIQLEDIIIEFIKINYIAKNFTEVEEWKKSLHQLQLFMRNVHDNEWVAKFDKTTTGAHRITLKPIFVDKFAQDYLFTYGNKVLLMSATILMPKVVYNSLGIKSDDAYAYRMKSRFPVENRPVYFKPSGSMSFKNKQDTLPRMIKDIDKICEKYHDKRGIIHTHNFEICEQLMQFSKNSVKSRFTYQKNFKDKDEMLKFHADKHDSIIIAPAMHEGLDLKGDLSQFQIICKVPYPSFKDNEQLKIRMDLSDDFYLWLTSLKLIQSAGRSIRCETDKADTFILDEDFKSFYHRAFKMMPSWFKESIIGI